MLEAEMQGSCSTSPAVLLSCGLVLGDCKGVAEETSAHGALHGLSQQARTLLKDEIDHKGPDGRARCTDVCGWLSSKIATPEQRSVHGQALRGLFLDCSSALGFSETTEHQEFYPDVADYKTGRGPSSTPTRFRLRLWQLGVAEVSHVKGAPPLHGIRDCVQ